MIDAGRIEEIMKDCLFTEAEVAALDPESMDAHEIATSDHPPFLAVQGVVHKFAFNPERTPDYRDEIKAMLEQLDDGVRKSIGGGISLISMVATKLGDLWGEQYNAEQLAALAIAMDLGDWVLPRDLWSVLPGGMPYFVYFDDASVSAA